LIVAPHHLQRIAIWEKLHDKKYRWTQNWVPTSDEFIQTVERAQGQEVDTVIVDYGISDLFQIKKEVNFIYSRNRLNVSITRAKKKCVVLLTDILLQTVFEVFDCPETEWICLYARTSGFYKKNSYLELTLSEVKKFVHDLEKESLFS